jgi:hypothetical protein
LSFNLVTCQRCGVERIRGVPCADCGRRAEAWEIDQGFIRRRAVAESLVSKLAADVAGEAADLGEQGPLSAPQQVATWIDRFWAALHSATDSEFRDSAELTAAVEELVLLRSSLVGTEPTRPFGRAVLLAQSMAAACVLMVQRYLDALMAATPVAAQVHAEQAQLSLDEFGDLAGDLATWLERQLKVSEASTVQESLWALVADSMEVAGAESLLPLARHNQAQLAATLGIEPELDAAIDYGINVAFADIFLSKEAFDRKLRASFELLTSDISHVEDMLRDPEFQRDLSRLQLELFDSGVACQRAIAEATHLRQAARAVVELNASLVESAGLLLGLPLLTAAGQKTAPYSTLRKGDATDHLRRAQGNSQVVALLTGLDPHLRTAQAHRAVTYGDEVLTTDLKSGKREYVYNTLVGSTFEAMESVFAGLAAIKLAAAVRGIDTAGDSGLESLGFSGADIVEFVFGAFGFPDRIVTVEDDCLVVELGNDSILGVTGAVVAMLASVPANSFRALRIVLANRNEWKCDLDVYVKFRGTSDDFEKQVALMRIQAAWRTTLDTRWLTTPAVQKWTATQVTETMDLPTVERFARLRLLRDLAADLGEPQVEAVVRGFVGWARLDLVGQQGGQPERQALAQVLEWAQMKIDFDLI